MSERRRAARPESITVELSDGTEVVANPLYWMDRNDLGNEILRQYADSTNEAIKSFVDDSGTPQLSLMLNDKLKDPNKILALAYPEVKNWPRLSWPELLELIYIACDVNGLENLRVLIDPNSSAPTLPGGTSGSGESDPTNTLKMPFIPGSDLPDSLEEKQESSTTSNLPQSSKSSNDNDQQSDTGT